MIQIMPVGNGIVIAVEHQLKMDEHQRFIEAWREKFPGIPAFLASEARIVLQGDQPILFEFTGDVTPTVVAEFQRWWKEVNA